MKNSSSMHNSQQEIQEISPNFSSHFLPDLSTDKIIQLQKNTADKVGLSATFSDRLKDDGSAPKMVVIPAGQYEMGSTHDEYGHSHNEYPQHYTHIPQPFAIGKFTITADEFECFIKDTEWYKRPELIWTKGRQPQINIRMPDALLYIDWLNDQTGKKYRLPTESEWEYAARAGTTTAFHFGDDISCKDVHFHALFPYNEAKQRKRWYLPKCAPMATSLEVGSKPANTWGLHEVHGNVWEFTDTPWRDTHLNINRDGSVDNNYISSSIVTKGGSWFDSAVHARSASRMKRLYDEMDVNLGFRIVREIV